MTTTKHRKKPKECRELLCDHARCAHGRPHCPVCPMPRENKLRRVQWCAACSERSVVPGKNVCQACLDRGVEPGRLFDGT